MPTEQPDGRLLTQAALADLAATGAVSRWVTGERGVRLHVIDYTDVGAADERPPLVILPGITMPAIGMDFVARALADLVRPVVLDVRGRGLSDSGPDVGAYDLPTYAADVEAVVAELGLAQPILLGHSMGARIATAAAARARITVRSVIAVDPPMSGPGRGPYPTPLAVFEAQLAQARGGTSAEEVAASWPRWPRREQALRARWLGSCSAEAIAATHAAFESEDFFEWWSRVDVPTTLIHGAESPVVTAAGAREAALGKPDAVIVAIPGAGHMVHWDAPGASLASTRLAVESQLGIDG